MHTDLVNEEEHTESEATSAASEGALQSSGCLVPAGYKLSKPTLPEIYHTSTLFFTRA